MTAKIPDVKTIMNVYANLGLGNKCALKDDIKRQLRIVDEQDAIHRYNWFNLPSGLTGDKIERMLYYRGKLAFFYEELNDTFYCLPFCYDGQIDVYGEFSKMIPMTFGTSKKEEKAFGYGKSYDILKEYTIPATEKEYCNSAVVLFDYTPQMDINNIIPRYILQDSVIDTMAECFPLARTAMISNTGIRGMRVGTEDDAQNVNMASNSVLQAALNGTTYVPIVGQVDFQDLSTNGSANIDEFLKTMQSLNNFRKSCYGLDSGGIFEKNAHVLQSEQAANTATSENPYIDGLNIRQRFCDMINLFYGLNVWVEPNETAIHSDINRNGTTLESGEKPDVTNVNVSGGETEDGRI